VGENKVPSEKMLFFKYFYSARTFFASVGKPFLKVMLGTNSSFLRLCLFFWKELNGNNELSPSWEMLNLKINW